MKVYLVEMDLINGIKIVNEFDANTEVQDPNVDIFDYVKDEFEGVMGFYVSKDQAKALIAKGYGIVGHQGILDEERIILDNGGGITLQLQGWAHHYNGAEQQCADDIAAWLATGDTSSWDGFEANALDCNPSDEEIRNGGYTIVDISTLEGVIKDLEGEGKAGTMVAEHLKKLI